MNKYFVFTILSAFIVLLAFSGPATAQDRAITQDRGDRVCLYREEKFKSHEQCYRPGDEVPDLRNAEIESLRVFGHARAMLYEDRDFRGRMIDISADIPDLKRVLSGTKSFHEHIGSLRVTADSAFNRDRVYDSDRADGRYKPFPSSERIDEGVCVYERPNYEGRSQCWASGTNISDLRSSDWRDRISSIKVFGDARMTAYDRAGFHGDRVVIDHDMRDIGGNLRREMSSVEVH
jgi:peptidase inhibitor family I36